MNIRKGKTILRLLSRLSKRRKAVIKISIFTVDKLLWDRNLHFEI